MKEPDKKINLIQMLIDDGYVPLPSGLGIYKLQNKEKTQKFFTELKKQIDKDLKELNNMNNLGSCKNNIGSCKTCKFRNGCIKRGKTTGDNICCLNYQYDNTNSYETSEGTNYPEETQRSGFVKPKTTLTLVAQEKKYCDYIIDKIKDDIEEEFDYLTSERKNYIGELPKEMFAKLVDLRNTLITLSKILNYVGYSIDAKDYINDLDTKIIELGGKTL